MSSRTLEYGIDDPNQTALNPRKYAFTFRQDFWKSFDYKVEEITFGYAQIREKDKSNSFLYIPVWHVLGTTTKVMTEFGVEEGKKNMLVDTVSPIQTESQDFVFNAITGSLIDREYNGF